MGTGLCSEELTDDFCSALHAISEFRNAPVCMCVYFQSLRKMSGWGNLLCGLNSRITP